MDITRLWVIVAISSLLFSCVGSNQPAVPPSDEQTPQVSTGLEANQFPPIPVDKEAAVITDTILGASDVWLSSWNADPDGQALILIPSTDLAYGIWQIGSMPDVQQVQVDLTLHEGGGAYIALADYSKGAWDITGPQNDSTIIPLDNERNLSPGGNYYIAVIAPKQTWVSIDRLVLAIDRDWHIMTLDSSSYAGKATSLAVVNGNPAISYKCGIELRYKRASNADGTEWNDAIQVHDPLSPDFVGEDTSLAIVNSRPAIAYRFNSNELYYVRAEDVDGQDWLPPIEVDDGGAYVISAKNPSLTNVDGKPAIGYGSSGNLHYVRAIDIDGSAWPDPIILQGGGPFSGDNFSRTSMVVFDGSPSTSYFQSDIGGFGNLWIIAGTDSTGSTWFPPQPVDLNPGGAGVGASGALVNFGMSISYSDSVFRDLKYAWWSIKAGEWQIVDVDTEIQCGETSIAVINGNPAVCYIDYTNEDTALKYVRALDSKGEEWGVPELVDNHSQVGTYNSLAEVNGKPAISYFDTSSLNLKYAIRLDP